MSDILFRYLHLIAVLVLAGALIIENLAISPRLSPAEVRSLLRVDAAYGISAALVLILGLLLWFVVGKPASFYSLNPVFHAKVGLFVLVGLLSIYPTVFLLRQRRSTEESVEIPPLLILTLRVELLLLLVIPVLAFLMARGIGLSSTP